MSQYVWILKLYYVVVLVSKNEMEHWKNAKRDDRFQKI